MTILLPQRSSLASFNTSLVDTAVWSRDGAKLDLRMPYAGMPIGIDVVDEAL
ncbi:hypothetical protein ACJJI3_13195 [Microbulbifer sp. ZKSA004]|uniref:hypothetical protein n=1 Tax=Microbulbifer sp. ZKSA004 TaxID=3243389 RepID=UPI00403A14DD